MEELKRSLDGTDGSHALATCFKARSGRQGGQSGECEDLNGGGRGKRDGKDRPTNQQRRRQSPHQSQQKQYQLRHQ